MTNAQALAGVLPYFDTLYDFQKEIVVRFIECPNLNDCKYDGGTDHSCCTSCKIRWLASSGMFDNVRSVEIEHVRHGRWIKKSYLFGEYEFECSVCHEIECRTSANRMKYCMFCGAKMDGGAEE